MQTNWCPHWFCTSLQMRYVYTYFLTYSCIIIHSILNFKLKYIINKCEFCTKFCISPPFFINKNTNFEKKDTNSSPPSLFHCFLSFYYNFCWLCCKKMKKIEKRVDKITRCTLRYFSVYVTLPSCEAITHFYRKGSWFWYF